MFDFSVSPQTGLAILIILLLVWVLLSVQGLGERVLSLENMIHTTIPKVNQPIQASTGTTPIVNLNEIPPQIFEPFNQPSNASSSYRLLSSPSQYAQYSDYSNEPTGLQFNFEGKGWTGMAIPKNSQFAEFM